MAAVWMDKIKAGYQYFAAETPLLLSDAELYGLVTSPVPAPATRLRHVDVALNRRDGLLQTIGRKFPSAVWLGDGLPTDTGRQSPTETLRLYARDADRFQQEYQAYQQGKNLSPAGAAR